ncbi:MAG: phosphomannomutase/phosphoglucomutase [Clostridiales bacterium]|jgi:phosphoglucomutase/phosphomannomutase family protein|nr:phosphomannomutase/phosphoglucomutase [Clostridiales bacterium]
MLNETWKKLQNGSDIRGVALEGIEGQPVNLTPEIAMQIACSFGAWLSDKTGKLPSELTIAVGNDSRLSAEALNSAVTQGLSMIGITVINCGLCSTPAMFMTTVMEGYQYDGSIMLTASHLPFNRNGLKFFTKDGGLEKGDITKILELAQDKIYTRAGKLGEIRTIDFIQVYAADIVRKIRNKTGEEQPLKGFRIVVDAGNGAGGFYADQVLKPLGACTEGSQFLDPDGSFPNHIPNPEDKTAMASIQKAVVDQNADFGIIFDTDVDRAGAVDRTGREINRNRIIALIAAIAIEEHPGATIVTDSITSSGLKKFIETELGGVHHRFKRGYKNVINEAIRLNREGIFTPVAIETSGHGALKENYFLDDGAYLIAKILIKMAQLKKAGRTIDSLIEKLEEPAEAKEFRMGISCADFKTYGNSVIEKLGEFSLKQEGWNVEPNNFEGIRVTCDKLHGDGWFLLRLSLHDPLMPLNIESNTAGGVEIIVDVLRNVFRNFAELDASSL